MLSTDTIKYPAEDQLYEVPDKIRKLKFTGRMIGKATTRREGGEPRWTDITIYRTTGGSYVVQREGVSLVYHRSDASCRGGEVVRNEDILEDSVPCRDCNPPGIDALDDIRERFDRDRNRRILLSRTLGEDVPDPDPGETETDYHARLSLKFGVDQDVVQEIFEDVDKNLKESADPDRYRMEVTMSSADVAEKWEKIVPILTYRGRLGSVATEAIEAAAKRDESLAGIFKQVEVIE